MRFRPTLGFDIGFIQHTSIQEINIGYILDTIFPVTLSIFAPPMQ